jgi:hypothetical protein
LKLLNLLELTFVFRNVLVFCHFFLEKKVTKNSRLCRNPAILLRRFSLLPINHESLRWKSLF